MSVWQMHGSNNDFFQLFQCRDTYYIESFHNCLLIYVPKRIHFGDKVYNMRVNIACLDWVCVNLLVHYSYPITCNPDMLAKTQYC